MKKRENTGRIALGLLLSGIVFITNLGVLLLTLCALYGLVYLGVIETTGRIAGCSEILFLCQLNHGISSGVIDRENNLKSS